MSLREDATGRLWIGTRSGGLCVYDPRTDQFATLHSSQKGEPLGQLDVAALSCTPDGTVWIGTNKGLFFVRPNTTSVHRLASFPREYISALTTDKAGTLWIGTYRGYLMKKPLHSDQLSVYHLPLSSPINQQKWITCIVEDARRQLHVGTWGGGVFRLNKQTQQFEHEWFVVNEHEKRNLVKAIVEDQHQTLWLATDDGLVLAPQGDLARAQHIRAGNGQAGNLTTHALQSLLTDTFGNVWIGTWEGGLNVYYAQTKHFHYLTQTDGLPTNRPTGVVADARHITVATGKGIAQINRRSGQVRLLSAGQDITNLIQYRDQVAALIWNQGADFYEQTPAGLRKTGQQRNATNPYRTFIFSRTLGRVVANPNGQLYRLEPTTHRLSLLPVANQTTSFGVATALYETQTGKLFIGSYNQGLWVYDPVSRILQPVGHRRSIGNEQVLCLLEDRTGQLWIGTNGNGLFRYRPQTDDFQAYTTESGLPGDVVNSLVEDKTGRLWIGTNDGLYQFNPQTGTGRTYAEKDGLMNREFVPNAAFRDDEGYLFFGGMEGIDYFHPDSLNQTRQQPNVYLTGLRLLNKPVTPNTPDSPLMRTIGSTTQLRLNHRQAVSVTFEFVGLFFRKKAECQYQYRLDGFDTEWNNVGLQRNATYTNLPPGTYTFRVKAANADGIWTSQDARLAIVVLPPWYRTGCAYTVYVLLLAAGLWSYRRFVRQREQLRAELRLRQIEAEQAHELERIKTTFFTNISHEFRTPLTLILDPVAQLEQGNLSASKVQESYRVIRQNGQRLLRLINELLDLSKIEAERYRLHIEHADLVDFVKHIVHSFDLQAERRQVRLLFDADAPCCMADFSPDALEKIAFNLIANAIKACRPGDIVTVSVQTQPTRGQLVLTVRDTGVGLTETDQKALFSRFFQASTGRVSSGTGIGLALTAELVKLHKGRIQFDSQPGLGTTMTVILSVDRAEFPTEWISLEPAAPTQLPDLRDDLAETPQTVSMSPGKPQVLVVEDNDELRTYIQQQFSAHYAVLTAENGRIGWELALQYLPDLIVSDVIMPELDGIELCRRLKTDEKTSHIPVILLTSRSSVESQLQGLLTGADDYQTKPFTFQLLVARIENLIRQRQQLRERFGRGMRLQPSQLTVNDTDEQFLKRAMAAVEANLSDATFDVEQLEKAMNMSQMQLYRKLTSLTSMSGNVFIRHIRLHQARQLLEESNLTVAEIAYRVGFNNPSYFARAYKKEFGVVPSRVHP